MITINGTRMEEIKVAVCFSRADDFVGDAIRFFTGGDVNHVFLAWRDPNFAIPVTLGANPNGLTLAPYERFLKAPEHVMAVFVPEQSLWPGIRKLAPMLDTPYDYGGLLGMTMVEVVHRTIRRWIPNPWHSKLMFCSEYVRRVLKLSGLDPHGLEDVPVSSTDPARLMRAISEDGRFRKMPGTELP